MAYISANEVKAIRTELKAQFPNFKFSVKKGYNGSSVDVTVVEGPVDFAEIFNDAYALERKYAQINQYHLYNYGKHEQFFEQILKIIKIAPALVGGRAWFDDSDSMVDYFHTAYYIHINVGAWDRPYICNREYA